MYHHFWKEKENIALDSLFSIIAVGLGLIILIIMGTKNWLPQSLVNFMIYRRKILIISFGNNTRIERIFPLISTVCWVTFGKPV